MDVTLGSQNSPRRPSVDRLSAADAADQPCVNETGSPPSNNVAGETADDDDVDDDDENVQVYKVMVMGSHGVGKTTLVQQLLTSEYLANVDDDRGQSLKPYSHYLPHFVSSYLIRTKPN